jgi:hypothetical protein
MTTVIFPSTLSEPETHTGPDLYIKGQRRSIIPSQGGV